MDPDKHEQLVRRLERIDAQNPSLYRLMVGAVAIGGYVFYTVLVLGTAALVGLLVAALSYNFNVWILYAVLGLLIVLWSFLRSLWVRIPEPEGIRLREEESPELFRDVREIAQRVGAPRVHRVLITTDFNASLAQVPRLGVLGWQKNYLSVGMPLLAALAHDEFQAVLAHEFGHLSGFHGRFGGWVYRVRTTWLQGVEALQAQTRQRRRGFHAVIVSVTSATTLAFLERYVPFLDACSFVLRRRQEYEADAFAAQLFGAETIIRALANMRVRSQSLNQFWQEVWKSALETAEPPQHFYSKLAVVARDTIPSENVGAVLAAVAVENTGYADSHPCLRDRAQALGVALEADGEEMQLGAPVARTAWQYYFGESQTEIIDRVESEWRQLADANWKLQFTQTSEAKEKYAELAAIAEPSNDQLLEIARCKLMLEGGTAAKPVFEELLRRDASNRAAGFQLAQIALHENRPEGEAMMLAAMDVSVDYTRAGLLALRDFHVRGGNLERVRECEKKLRDFEKELERARAERKGCTAGDAFLPAELPEDAIDKLRALFAEYERLDKAYVVRKAVQHLPKYPYFIVGLKPRRHWWGGWSKSDISQLMPMAKWIKLPGEGWVIVLTPKKRQLAKCLRAVPGSEVYARAEYAANVKSAHA